MNERTVKCGICGEPYKIYSMYVGDQSACPDCIRKAEDKIRKRQQVPFVRSASTTDG